MCREEFIDALMNFGGISDEILDHEEVLGFFLPVLKADFQAFGDYVHEPSGPLDIPVSVMLGTEDRIQRGRK